MADDLAESKPSTSCDPNEAVKSDFQRIDPEQVEKQEVILKWPEVLENYVRETETITLNLAGKALNKEEVQFILNFLPDSAVTELNLEGYCLQNGTRSGRSGMSDLAPLLIKSKVEKLNISFDKLSKKDLTQLVEVLKYSQITQLKDSELTSSFIEVEFDLDEAHTFISNLQKSQLTVLTLDFFRLFPPVGIRPLLQEFFNTSITCLDLKDCQLSSNDLVYLFGNLSYSSVEDLSLRGNQISSKAVQELSLRLAETKIAALNLSETGLKDDELKVLAEGLVHSNVTNLDLSSNNFTSFSSLFAELKETQITTLSFRDSHSLREENLFHPECFLQCSLTSLDLHDCYLEDQVGEELMESLKFSNITTLNLSLNRFGAPTLQKFAEVVTDINLTDFDMSSSFDLTRDEFFTFWTCLKDSKLETLNVSHFTVKPGLEVDHLISCLQLTEGSTIKKIEINGYGISVPSHPISEPKFLANTTFTELYLQRNWFRGQFSHLVTFLKCTSLTHLDLIRNGLIDVDVIALAACLKGSQIRRLNLSNNRSITNKGLEALALSLKDSNILYLYLNNIDHIDDEGIEFLAEHLKDTYVTELEIFTNERKKVTIIDAVLWQNRISVHKLSSFFEQITPLGDEFCFECCDLDDASFREKCLWFYKTLLHNPAAVSVLLEQGSVSCSKEQITKLIFELFPSQFSGYIACSVEGGLTEHVSILKNAEELGLTALVESLLLNRPVYMLDEGKNILHPYVYKLLRKYHLLVCHRGFEPSCEARIIEYFTEHPDVEGAQEIVSLLS